VVPDAGPDPDAGTGGAAGDASLQDSAADSAVQDATPGDAPADGDAANPDGGFNPGDDPCPTGPIWLNCSDSCGKKSPECASLVCGIHMYLKEVTDPASFPIIIRTPSRPGWIAACTAACPEKPTACAVTLPIGLPTSKDAGGYTHGIRVRVGYPWRIQKPLSMLSICLDPSSPPKCRVFSSDAMSDLEVVTDDPNAPAKNVLIERLPNPVVCL
jgi:hypothetical protein